VKGDFAINFWDSGAASRIYLKKAQNRKILYAYIYKILTCHSLLILLENSGFSINK
jgi:hypothetical protein